LLWYPTYATLHRWYPGAHDHPADRDEASGVQLEHDSVRLRPLYHRNKRQVSTLLCFPLSPTRSRVVPVLSGAEGRIANAWLGRYGTSNQATLPHVSTTTWHGLSPALGLASTPVVVYSWRWSPGSARKWPKSACQGLWCAESVRDRPETGRVEWCKYQPCNDSHGGAMQTKSLI